jgi:hypothetical protein
LRHRTAPTKKRAAQIWPPSLLQSKANLIFIATLGRFMSFSFVLKELLARITFYIGDSALWAVVMPQFMKIAVPHKFTNE